MREHGFITSTSYAAAAAEPVALHDSLRREDSTALHFKEIVRRELIERFGKEAVYQGRLRVYTTVDPDMQKAAEAAVVQLAPRHRSADRAPRPQRRAARPGQRCRGAGRAAAGVAARARSGDRRSPCDRRRARHAERWLEPRAAVETSAGSAFKPFVYAAAIENGYSPSTVIERLNEPIETYQGAWLPEDEHSQPLDDDENRAADVEQSRRRSACSRTSASSARSRTRRILASARCRTCRRSPWAPARSRLPR